MAVLLMSAAVLWTSVLCCTVGTPIDGPQPMNIVAPLNTKIAFSEYHRDDSREVL